ncbi:unnamed protein product [Schistosoma turkestanicum]|nr:unnamed protein product [Schistosoma turkestanicum]
MYLEFLSTIFEVLVTSSSQFSSENFPSDSLDVECVESIARSLIMFVTEPKLGSSTQLNTCILTEHVTSLVQSVLVNTRYDHYYISVASVLSELQKFCSNDSVLSETISQFFDQLIQSHIINIEICFMALRRLTLWLTWSELSTHQSSIDLWLIGFQCEMFKRFPPTESQSLSDCWSDFMSWQLKFVLELMGRLSLPHESTVYALAFLILSGDSKRDRYADDIVSHLAPVLNKLLSIYVDDPLNEGCKEILLKIYTISRLIDPLDNSNGNHLSKACTQRTKHLAILLRKFHSQFNDENSSEIWSSRTKVYKLESLAKFGLQAGIRLRKIWERWNSTSAVRITNIRPTTLKTNRSVAGYIGLLNVGNTCYANAALQLLYHCSEFRRALFGFHKADSSTGTVLTSCTSFSTKIDSVSSSQNSTPSNNRTLPVSNLHENAYSLDNPISSVKHQGILHAHLFSLFKSLDTHQLPTVRDIRAVLTLTKPAHFVSGEQQDAAEYLNYLLDRLHEEELYCKKQMNLCLDSYSKSSTFMADQNIQSAADTSFNPSTSYSYNPSKESCSTDPVQNGGESASSNDSSSSSTVARLFGGTLLRHTSCVECQHVSSSRQEQFICLYVPITKPRALLYQDQTTPNENPSLVNNNMPEVKKESGYSSQEYNTHLLDRTFLLSFKPKSLNLTMQLRFVNLLLEKLF